MIRNATPCDALAVAPLMFQAMEEIVYKMIGKPHKEEAIALLAQLLTNIRTKTLGYTRKRVA